ncbi:MAG: serine hydrolase, partial [Longimicrobiales bacterium]|nr:serine hydrolase [Longimicrobiales bacterium]
MTSTSLQSSTSLRTVTLTGILALGIAGCGLVEDGATERDAAERGAAEQGATERGATEHALSGGPAPAADTTGGTNPRTRPVPLHASDAEPPPNPVSLDGSGASDRERRRTAMLARAEALELDTPYEPPPGRALHHHTAGFANILCSAIFLTGLDWRDAARNVGGFSSPFDERDAVVDTVVDRERREVRLTLPDGVVRSARHYGSQGCVAHPIGEDTVSFEPSVVEPRLPPAETTPWPMGDIVSDEPWSAGDGSGGVNLTLVEEALDVGFGPPEAMTLALVVTYQGRILGERYADGIGIHTPLESWSMNKSLTGTLMGVLIQQGEYDLWQSAPIPEWQEEADDPRQEIRIGDIMRMSSGIRIRAPQDPDYDSSVGYPDHLYLYTGTTDSFRWAATRPPQWPPNTVGRYRNSDPVLTNYLIRLAVEARGEDYHAFPQRHLFDRIGIRDAYLQTDPHGNFLLQGYGFLSARDWARLGNLYLQDGIWYGGDGTGDGIGREGNAGGRTGA